MTAYFVVSWDSEILLNINLMVQYRANIQWHDSTVQNPDTFGIRISTVPFFYLFSTRPSPLLLPVLGPLGSGTYATHQPGPALRLLGYLPLKLSFLHTYSKAFAIAAVYILAANTLGPLS